MDLTRINDNTPVHEFPEIHNQNISELEQEIATLNAQIAEKDNTIKKLQDKFNSALNALRAEYISMFDNLDSKYKKIDEE